MPLKKRLVEQEMSLDTNLVKTYTSRLAGFLVEPEFAKLLESQGEISTLNKKITDFQSSTAVLNKEFEERHGTLTPYKLPLLSTNQNILLLGFYFSYAFLTLVSLIVVYKNTGSMQKVAYAFLMAGVVLLIVTAILIRVA
jgi:hypothetical protein